mgnify:CR=1 FL=1
MYRSHKCEAPLPQFGDEPISGEFLYTYEKQFDKCHLVKPPQAFIDYMSSLEELFESLFNQFCHRKNLSQIIFNELKVPHYLCCDNVKHEDILNMYIRVRIYYVLRAFNTKQKVKNYSDNILCISHK